MKQLLKRKINLETSSTYFKAYCKSVVIKAVWCWYKHRKIENRKRTIEKYNKRENPWIDSHINDQLTFEKSAKQ